MVVRTVYKLNEVPRIFHLSSPHHRLERVRARTIIRRNSFPGTLHIYENRGAERGTGKQDGIRYASSNQSRATSFGDP